MEVLFDAAGWIISVCMIAVGLAIAVGNARLMLPLSGPLAQWRTSGSPVPLFGGAAASLGCLLAPNGVLTSFACLPLLLDPGCLMLAVLIWRQRR